jgi:hypothetical protein
MDLVGMPKLRVKDRGQGPAHGVWIEVREEKLASMHEAIGILIAALHRPANPRLLEADGLALRA